MNGILECMRLVFTEIVTPSGQVQITSEIEGLGGPYNPIDSAIGNLTISLMDTINLFFEGMKVGYPFKDQDYDLILERTKLAMSTLGKLSTLYHANLPESPEDRTQESLDKLVELVKDYMIKVFGDNYRDELQEWHVKSFEELKNRISDWHDEHCLDCQMIDQIFPADMLNELYELLGIDDDFDLDYDDIADELNE